MALDKVVDSAVLDAGMTATANAIREKTGETSSIPWEDADGFSNAVSGIVAKSYALVTVNQSCSNALAACTALEAYVGAEDQIVLFVREDYTACPSTDITNNTGLWFMWFSNTFHSETSRKNVWGRWRNNELSISDYTNSAYDYIIPAGTVFRKVTVR